MPNNLKKVVAGVKIPSIIDHDKGYHELEQTKDSISFSTIDTHIRLFHHKRLFLEAKSAAEYSSEVGRNPKYDQHVRQHSCLRERDGRA